MTQLTRRCLWIALILLFVYSPVAAKQSVDDLERRATELVEHLVAERFDAATQTFDDQLSRALTPTRLRAAWRQLQFQAGAFERVEGVAANQEHGYDVVRVRARFEKASIEVKLAFDEQARVTGLFFLPAPEAPEARSQLPEYVVEEAFTERTVTVGTKALPGVLTIPIGEATYPGVVLVHGSGPHDRDSTVGANKPFRDIAQGLASRGVAVLRYDKRTFALGAEALSGDEAFTVEQETVEDAVAAVELLREQPGVDRVFILGHSFGGMLAPRIASESDDVDGLILMAANARPLEVLVLAQTEYLANLDGSVTAAEQRAIAQARELVARVQDPSLKPEDQVNFGGVIPGSYFLDLRRYDPVAAAASLNLPMLILQGGRDYQVTEVDFEQWRAGLGERVDVEFRLFDSLNHLFMEWARTPSPADLMQPGHVEGEVIDALVAWIESSESGRGGGDGGLRSFDAE